MEDEPPWEFCGRMDCEKLFTDNCPGPETCPGLHPEMKGLVICVVVGEYAYPVTKVNKRKLYKSKLS